MSSFPFAEANRCRQNEWKDCQSFGTVCSSSQDSKGDFLCNIQSLISVIKNLAGRSCRWVDQTGLGSPGCLCLWGVAWYVKRSGLPYFLHFSLLRILYPWITFTFQDLENGPHASHLALLNTFAYGNYRSLMDNKANLPELTEVMVRKLRLLTMVRWHLLTLEFDPHENN